VVAAQRERPYRREVSTPKDWGSSCINHAVGSIGGAVLG